MFGISAGEFVIILIVGLIVFGPSKLPEVGRAIGKGLREFRKAQAALSQTLNEPLEPEKKSAPATSIRNEELGIRNEKAAEQKMTADDVINLAKESPIVKENHNEKISNDNSADAPAVNSGASVASAASSSNGTDKQPESAKN